MAKNLNDFLPKAAGGGGGTLIGGVTFFTPSHPPRYTDENGIEYIKNGIYEADTSKFDVNRHFSKLLLLPSAKSTENSGLGDTAYLIIAAVQKEDGTLVRILYKSTNPRWHAAYSKDGGQTWTTYQITAIPNTGYNTSFMKCVTKGDNIYLMLTSSSRMYISTGEPNQASWREVNLSYTMTGFCVTDNGYIYCAVNDKRRIRISTNDGASWTSVTLPKTQPDYLKMETDGQYVIPWVYRNFASSNTDSYRFDSEATSPAAFRAFRMGSASGSTTQCLLMSSQRGRFEYMHRYSNTYRNIVCDGDPGIVPWSQRTGVSSDWPLSTVNGSIGTPSVLVVSTGGYAYYSTNRGRSWGRLIISTWTPEGPSGGQSGYLSSDGQAVEIICNETDSDPSIRDKVTIGTPTIAGIYPFDSVLGQSAYLRIR